jgi:hypothetical protein
MRLIGISFSPIAGEIDQTLVNRIPHPNTVIREVPLRTTLIYTIDQIKKH